MSDVEYAILTIRVGIRADFVALEHRDGKRRVLVDMVSLVVDEDGGVHGNARGYVIQPDGVVSRERTHLHYLRDDELPPELVETAQHEAARLAEAAVRSTRERMCQELR